MSLYPHDCAPGKESVAPPENRHRGPPNDLLLTRSEVAHDAANRLVIKSSTSSSCLVHTLIVRYVLEVFANSRRNKL
jgi:hypothetical protein